MARSSEPSSVLEVLLTERALRLKAGPASYQRGERYATTQRVKKVKATETELSATVTGTSQYRVRIWAEEGDLNFSCTCPVGETEEFCKHCVAAGLVWLRGARATEGATEWSEPDQPAVDLRGFLLTRSKEMLVELLMERAAQDELFGGRLALQAAKAAAVPADLEPYRQAIEAAIVVDDFVHYRSMYDYSRNVTVAIRSIEEILEGGLAAEVIGLCEYALECVEDAIGRVDDSDGYMGEIKEELIELHHRACQVAHPDPEELAARLFDWAIHSEWETFLDGADRYADVLGDAGLLRYRSLAQQVWDQVPARQAPEQRVHSSSNFRITYIMETLAKVSESVDELVAIKARDLTYAYHYVEIVELLADAGRTDEALAWAERGIAAFPNGTDVRLRDVAARELHRVGRDDEAMSLIWAEFEDRPTSKSYEFLHRHATEAGAWSEWRTRALNLMRQNEARARSARSVAATTSPRRGLATWKPPRGYDEHPESSELVTVFLWENETESAWAQAKAGGCSPRLWMRLAELRQYEHPNDAIPIYQEEVERAIGAKDNRGYREAVDTMIRVRTLMQRAGHDGEFPSYAARVRAAHKAKRNLMKLFDGQGW
jgi:uncharacterized Zn finger protein